jgi:competence protein ComEA
MGVSSSTGSAQNGSSMVNINTASITELDRLPGVGPATAQKIIDYRNQIGRFSSIDQLLEVKGIGTKKLEQMRPYITF